MAGEGVGAGAVAPVVVAVTTVADVAVADNPHSPPSDGACLLFLSMSPDEAVFVVADKKDSNEDLEDFRRGEETLLGSLLLPSPMFFSETSTSSELPGTGVVTGVVRSTETSPC